MADDKKTKKPTTTKAKKKISERNSQKISTQQQLYTPIALRKFSKNHQKIKNSKKNQQKKFSKNQRSTTVHADCSAEIL